MNVGVLLLHLQLPGCRSLKEKRNRLKPLLHRLHREFNVSVAEMDYQDHWQQAMVACACISNSPPHTERALRRIPPWIESHYPDIYLLDERLELL